jgi:predicted nucleotidyltransferase
MAILAEILSSRVRAEFFRILFGINSNEYHLREIQRQSGYAIGTVRQEAKKLERLQLITKRVDGNRTYYKANRQHPLYKILHEMVLQTSGLVDIFERSLDNRRIEIAFIFGSIAQGTEKSDSDIDLFIVGSISMRELSTILKEPRQTLNREINPYIMKIEELKMRKRTNDHFISNVFKSPKLFIIGTENDLTKLGK